MTSKRENENLSTSEMLKRSELKRNTLLSQLVKIEKKKVKGVQD